MRNFCTRCGSRIKSIDRFCGNCGASLIDGLGPEELNSVSVKGLDSGDIVFFRPPEPPPKKFPPLESPTLSEHDSEGGAFEDDIISTSDINDEPPLNDEKLAPRDIFADGRLAELAPLDKISLREADKSDEPEDSFPFPPDVPVLEKLKQLDEMEKKKNGSEPEPVPEPDEFDDETVRKFLNDEPLDPPQDNESISVLGWVGIIFLLLIPGVNVLLLIVWALGGCRKKQKAQFARAVLIVAFIIALLIFVSFTYLKDYIDDAIRSLLGGSQIPAEFTLRLFKGILETAETWGIDAVSLFPLN